MSIIMNPVLPLPAAELPAATPSTGSEKVASSFARHLDQRISEKYGAKRDKLGVPDRQEAAAAEGKNGEASSVADSNKQRRAEAADATRGSGQNGQDADDTLLGLLGLVMSELRSIAAEQQDLPGEWRLNVEDGNFLQQMAEAAGMDEEDFSHFLQQLGTDNGSVPLEDFFSALAAHFQEMAAGEPITVSETHLPMLENLLSRMGISQQGVDEIGSSATTGEGLLDLERLLAAVGELQNRMGAAALQSSPITLSTWEGDELQNMLLEAGLTLEQCNELLPERYLNQALGREGAGQPVVLDLERLRTMLQQATAAVQDAQPKVDLPTFLTDLQQVAAQAQFQQLDVGWTPVVEETVTAVFQKLQEIVDMANIKLNAEKMSEDQMLEQEADDWFRALEEKFVLQADGDASADVMTGNDSGNRLVAEESSAGKVAVSEQGQAHSPFSVNQTVSETRQPVEATQHAAADRLPPRQLQQQVMQQLSDGVLRGLRSQEHQLVLRLYPQELGEVKVNLLVRDEHVSVSFQMENIRVKEMLESNMEEFRQSMDQKGFTLGECSVSVGQQDEGNDLWQRFEAARFAVQSARATLADVPDNALYLNADALRSDGRPDGISLFV